MAGKVRKTEISDGRRSKQRGAAARVRRAGLRGDAGQSLIEIALCTPVLMLILFYTLDYSYYFIVTAALTSSAQHAVEYAIQGYASPAGAYSSTSTPAPPPAGPISTSNSVAALAIKDISTLVNASTKTTVQVCSTNVNSAKTYACQTYGATTTSWTPDTDPESLRYKLFRVDVQYTVSPPIPLSFLGYNLVPTYTFHRMAEMRGMN